VRRVELIDLEATIVDPKVIDIRPHLAHQKTDDSGQQSGERRAD
jgi:hypothetical protein